MQAKDIAQQLAARAEEVARHLLPRGKRQGKEWCVGDISGKAGASFKVCVSGPKAGVWKEFAYGDGGDLLDLWALITQKTLLEAMKECQGYLGMGKVQFAPKRALNFVKPPTVHLKALSEDVKAYDYLVGERKLTPQTLSKYGVSVIAGEIVFSYKRDNETILVKYLGLERVNGKKQVRVEKNCEPCLFGWHMIPDNVRAVAICEGEFDAMSLHQYGMAALSVPFGAGNHAWVEHEYDRLAQFDEIFICFDDDEAGKKGALELVERLGIHRCSLVQLPSKDANACLQQGVSKDDIAQAFSNAKTMDPQELKKLVDFMQAIHDEFYPPGGKPAGYDAPWQKTEGKILFRPGELSIWSGINGHGKSQFLGQVMLGMMEQGAKICIASLELRPSRLSMRLIKQATAMALPSPAYIDAVIEHYNEQLWLFDLVGNAKSDRLLEVFKYARHRYGVDVFVIDSFMMLDIAEDDYKAQKGFIERLCEFRTQYNCQIHLVVHPRKGADENSAPGKLDYKGTGAISDLADNCFTLWRNKGKEKALQKSNDGYPLTDKEAERLQMPDAILGCDKQRHGDWEGNLGFWFDAESFQYLPTDCSKAKRFVDFSSSIANYM
jgi:twinkle protein